AIYLPHAQQLVEKGQAYYCFCSNERIESLHNAGAFKYDKHCLSLSKAEVQARLDAGEPYVIRQNIPLEGTTSFTDMLYGEITVENSTLDDTVLIKSDGMPTYNFANVIDDHLMEITHIFRGNEFISSTPKFIRLYDAFGWDKPSIAHLPPIMKDEHNKLSKRKGDPSFEDLLEQGYIKDAVVNYIALLGWSPGTNQEFFTLPELVEAFSIEGVSKSPAIFDPVKLAWMNGEYIKKLTLDEFDSYAARWYAAAGVSWMDCRRISELMQSRISVFSEIPEKISFLTEMPEFSPELYNREKLKCTIQSAKEILPVAYQTLEALENWSEQAINEALAALPEKLGVKKGLIYWPVRIAISGLESTPGGAAEIAYLLGKAETLRRLKKSIEDLK
ncbi:MAG TPA: glutamate--tRNA ligase, partial [Clostridia bacterium]|nr:glutamate--tRNA ligase [Clostridia bacterium]